MPWNVDIVILFNFEHPVFYLNIYKCIIMQTQQLIMKSHIFL